MPNRYFADISSNNHQFIPPHYAAAGHICIAIKATEGEGYIDPDHRTWVNAAHSHHLAVIHYHFARPDLSTSPAAEAQHFYRSTRGLVSGRDFYVLDLERATPAGWVHDPAWSSGFDAAMMDVGVRNLILYASRSRLQISDRWLVNRQKWIWDADWSQAFTFKPEGYSTFARQYTDGQLGPEPRTFAGIGECDGNRLDPRVFQDMLTRSKCPC